MLGRVGLGSAKYGNVGLGAVLDLWLGKVRCGAVRHGEVGHGKVRIIWLGINFRINNLFIP